MATEYGFIYFLGNEAMPGVYKIGYTTNHPKARVEQLSSATACPMPFEIYACFGTQDPRDIEQEIHEELKEYRFNTSREFFRCSPLILQDLVRKYCDPFDDLVNTNTLDSECDVYSVKQEKNWKIQHFLEQSCDPIYWPTRSRGFF